MIIRLALAALILFALYRFVKFVQGKPETQRRSYYLSLIIGLAAAALVIMSMTGRVHWLAGLIGAAVPFVRQFVLNHVYRKLEAQSKQSGNADGQQSDTASGQQDRARQSGQQMSEREALAILGLDAGASEDEIIQAHRRLMQKLHPDRGGNDYLASQLNEAKETLLKRS